MSMRPRVALLDYGSGNLRSAERALARAGAEVVVTSDFQTCLEADGLVVPGVGAFAACMEGISGVFGERLVEQRLVRNRPVLGICVGMQVLFERGDEHGQLTAGLGQWPGVVERLEAPVLPHMGWNIVNVPVGSALFAGVEQERFYFVHSYGVRHWVMAQTSETLAAPRVTTADYGGTFVAAVENGPLCATQFHPEKSGDAGAHLLNNWVRGI